MFWLSLCPMSTSFCVSCPNVIFSIISDTMQYFWQDRAGHGRAGLCWAVLCLAGESGATSWEYSI